MTQRPSVEIASQGPVAVVQFLVCHVSDVEVISDASARIRLHLDQNHPTRVVFDFGNVRFFSSQVLGLLLEARAKLLQVQGKVVLCGVNPQLYRVFKITNLDTLFQFFPTRQAAVDALSTETVNEGNGSCT